ncbi:hypothetical protein GYMLUDRAFT_71690 [Collybiopsis luxurians FD-317 M1]|uniref:Uncharacterized protein n=1 Tax=Collybiopsis luxurians FD-317 M1 TaxID=944289 RepID=A0A0D0CKX2_9AGAR|nr:hypothetical protein GYMLUDRAFT_71690 [Collybiopsis luxurians FD-317 M1]
MSGKKLSNGTLSLRFMQNAQRAKQLKEVELEKAHVEDDGQWEIAKEIRDSWGPPAESDSTVSYEQSYLPFLFPSLPASGSTSVSPLPKGRRVFKRGKEIKTPEESESSGAAEPPAPAPGSPSSSSTRHNVKDKTATTTGRPVTKFTKVAKLAIFDNSQVGTDLRPPTNHSSLASSSTSSIAVAHPKNAFLKPAGVDSPKSSSTEEGIISGAREMKVKRERKISATQMDGEDGPKRKKKKKSKVAAD